MLSDVLSDAIYKIREYQESDPDWYDSIAVEIEIVISAMKTLLASMDGAKIEHLQKANGYKWTDEDMKNWHKFLFNKKLPKSDS